MDRFAYNNEFDKDVIFDKLSKLNEELEKETNKEESERDTEKETQLFYAQLMQGMKLSTAFGKNHLTYF